MKKRLVLIKVSNEGKPILDQCTLKSKNGIRRTKKQKIAMIRTRKKGKKI
jgi:hypothetical protein